MSLFLFSTFPKFVDEELNRRRKAVQNGEPAYIQKPKSPWMRMVSGFKPENGSRKALMGGDLDVGEKMKFGFENLYETQARDGSGGTTGERYRPKPTITSISVDEKLQSFECSVEWKANSIGQLERLFPHFMGLGTSVIVDWGWSDVPPGGIINASSEQNFKKMFKPLSGVEEETDVESANSEISSDAKTQFDHPKYDQLRKGQGKYSFVSGAIVDFSFSPDENGTFSCTTEVMSLSKAMRKLRTKRQEMLRVSDIQETQGPSTVKSPPRVPTFYEFIKEDFQSHLKEQVQAAAFGGNSGDTTQSGDVVSIGQGKNDESDLQYMESGKQNRGYFLTWGEIERLVNKYATLTKGGKKSVASTFKLDSSDTIISNYKGRPFSGNDFLGNPLEKPLSLRTTDPLVCVVDSSGKSNKFRTVYENPKAASDGIEIDKERQGFLYNLYIYSDFLKLSLKKQETLFDALQYILDHCSAACFDIWDFNLEVDSNIIKVVDKNMASNTVEGILSSSDQEYVFKPNTRKTVLKGFSFDTNLDDKIKSQIVAQRSAKLNGPNKDAAQNSRKDSAAKLFKSQYPGGKDIALGPFKRRAKKGPKKQTEGEDNSEDPGNLGILHAEMINDSLENSETTKESVQKKKRNVSAYIDSPGNRYGNLVYKGKESGESLAQKFSEKLQNDPNSKSPINSNNYLGMGAQLELKGIGGFSAYQVLKIKQIPKIFENNGVFSIESVSHSVSPDDWSTELKTTFVVKNQQ
jgi:hypothetical protein